MCAWHALMFDKLTMATQSFATLRSTPVTDDGSALTEAAVRLAERRRLKELRARLKGGNKRYLDVRKSAAVEAVKKLNEISVLVLAVSIIVGLLGVPTGFNKGYCLGQYKQAGGTAFGFLDSGAVNRLECFALVVNQVGFVACAP